MMTRVLWNLDAPGVGRSNIAPLFLGWPVKKACSSCVLMAELVLAWPLGVAGAKERVRRPRLGSFVLHGTISYSIPCGPSALVRHVVWKQNSTEEAAEFPRRGRTPGLCGGRGTQRARRPATGRRVGRVVSFAARGAQGPARGGGGGASCLVASCRAVWGAPFLGGWRWLDMDEMRRWHTFTFTGLSVHRVFVYTRRGWPSAFGPIHETQHYKRPHILAPSGLARAHPSSSLARAASGQEPLRCFSKSRGSGGERRCWPLGSVEGSSVRSKKMQEGTRFGRRVHSPTKQDAKVSHCLCRTNSTYADFCRKC